MSEHHDFSPETVFKQLFALTAIEVLWGYAFGLWFDAGKVILWGGLILAAVLKAILIAQYFMHFKFEGWIVKCLIIPTPFLIAYVMVMISPDISRSDHLDEPIGSMYDSADGHVKQSMADLSFSQESMSGGDGHGGDGSADGGH